MIEEAYVSFETARLLKEKGFNEGCNSYFVSDNEIALTSVRRNFNDYGVYLSAAPTQQMAMRWLREVHNIKINIFYNNSNYTIEYFEPNTQTGVGKFVFIGDGYNVYEQACETAIKYCLENLI